MMVLTNEGAVSPSQLGTRHLFFREIELLINKLNKPSKQHKICVPLTTFCYFELCSICLRKDLGCRNPQPTLETNTNSTYVGISTISKPYWTVFYRIKWALQDVSELGYLFLTNSSLHIIAWDLDVRDHSCWSWMMSNPVTQ